MLVLSRLENECLVICPPGCKPIRVTVVSLRNGHVRLGVDADPLIPVHREEVYQSMQRKGEVTPSLANCRP